MTYTAPGPFNLAELQVELPDRLKTLAHADADPNVLGCLWILAGLRRQDMTGVWNSIYPTWIDFASIHGLRQVLTTAQVENDTASVNAASLIYSGNVNSVRFFKHFDGWHKELVIAGVQAVRAGRRHTDQQEETSR